MGETADSFVREADINSDNKRPELSKAMELAISNMLESSRNFKFQPQIRNRPHKMTQRSKR